VIMLEVAIDQKLRRPIR